MSCADRGEAGQCVGCLPGTDGAGVRADFEKTLRRPYRFPAFRQTNDAWTPDLNEGNAGMMGMQEMLLQEVNGKILLFPAWPRGWDVHFKLHAPGQTTVEAEWRGENW